MLVDDWREAWKWVSTNLALIVVAVNALDTAGYLGPALHHWMGAVNIVLGTGIIGGRVIKQGASAPQAEGAKS